MRKRVIRSFVSVFLVMTVLLLSVTAASAAKKDSKNIEWSMNGITGWFYVPASLPDGVEPIDYKKEIKLHKYAWDGVGNSSIQNPQSAESATVTFVSGEEALKDALVVVVKNEIRDVNGEKIKVPVASLRVVNDKLTVPGTAVFHLSCESANFALETDIPLIVVSWDDYPLMKAKENPEEVIMKLYESFEPSWVALLTTEARYEEEIKAAVGAEHWSGRVDMEIVDNEEGAVNPQTNVNGIIKNRAKVVKGGTWKAVSIYEFNNIKCKATLPMRCLPYWIQGPTVVKPGETAEYTVKDKEIRSGRTFTWSLEGEGVTLDAEHGTVTAAADATEVSFRLTAAPSDGQYPAVLNGVVGTGVLADVEFALDEDAAVGYSFPVPADPIRFNEDSASARWYTVDGETMNSLSVDYHVFGPYAEYAEDPDVARRFYSEVDLSGNGVTVELDEEIEAEEGHPARIVIARVDNDKGTFSLGMLLYARNNWMARARVYSQPQNGTDWEKLPKVEKEDLVRIAREIRYDHAGAPVSVLDAAISVSTKEGISAVTAGKKLNFLAAFANPEKVNKAEKNDAVEWSVSGADGAELPAGVSISNKGVLSTGKAETVLQVEVKASSPVFHVSTVYPVTILPAAKKISVEPAELFFYIGTEMSAEVKAVLDPDTVPPLGITWTPAKTGIVEITPNEENGTASFKPLAEGKTTVAVKEPGGKNAKLTVSVVDPVEDVELTVSGKTTPGGTVTVKETILPKTAGNKNVEWTLDVGEEIATVSKGKVKISKDAPAGTVITVTCTALGAPEPVVRTVQIEVTEK